MVIILQQTSDNGKTFVSTLVPGHDVAAGGGSGIDGGLGLGDLGLSSFNSNFSVGSHSQHNSISERSVIYKQKIDSLFGGARRHTRPNPFKPTIATTTTTASTNGSNANTTLQPFCIRIEGASATTTIATTSATATVSSSSHGNYFKGENSTSSSYSSSSSSKILKTTTTATTSISSPSPYNKYPHHQYQQQQNRSVVVSSTNTKEEKKKNKTQDKIDLSQATYTSVNITSKTNTSKGREPYSSNNVNIIKLRRDRQQILDLSDDLEEEEGDEEEEEEEEEESKDDDDDEEDDDDYEKITETKSCSIVTDSLNNNQLHRRFSSDENYSRSSSSSSTAQCHTSSKSEQTIPKCSSSASHVSTVRLNCDTDSGDNTNNSSSNHISGAMPSDMNNKTVGESHMWTNGTYADSVSSPCNTEERQCGYGSSRNSPGGVLKFSVDYLGSIPVNGTTTALQDLQAPLRNLYMNFLTETNLMPGQLSITSDGLRFEAPKIRLVNPFTTICVWAAIKFVAQGNDDKNSNGNSSNSNSNNSGPINCAFMPLISDPEGQDKSRLFDKMEPELLEAYSACINNERGFRNPPIFACVMRASFSLDCHAFACKCAEDAIVVAANLYQSLVDKMRTGNKEGESGYGSLSRSPATQSQSSPHEQRSCSSASSSSSPHHHDHPCCASSSGLEGGHGNISSSGSGADELTTNSKINHHRDRDRNHHHRVVFSDSESIPVRPPRRKKKSSDGSASGSSGGGNSSSKTLKRYNSDDSILLKMPHRRKGNYQKQNGGSFDVTSGVVAGAKVAKVKKRVQIYTPEETTTSSDSVNESIDQVLDRIINPGGMSFNDLKPSYQELILKIALTLTQDQLYQKSKQAMKKHQVHIGRKNKSKSSSSSHHTESPEDSQFLNGLLKSFSKITSSSSKVSGGNISSKRNGGFSKSSKSKSRFNNNNNKNPTKNILKKNISNSHHSSSKDEDPFMSFCSGCMCEKCSEKCYCSLPMKHNVKIIGLPPPSSSSSTNLILDGDQTTGNTSVGGNSSPNSKNDNNNDDSEHHHQHARKKTCGYDTDSCAESTKCYCSLQRVKSNGLKIYNINLDSETSDTDTNSYDLEPFHENETSASSSSNMKTVSARSVEILSYHPSKRMTYNLASSPTSNTKSNSNVTNGNIKTTSAIVHFEEDQHNARNSHPHTQCTGILSKGFSSNNNSNNSNGGFRSYHSAGSSSSYLHQSSSDDQMMSASPNSSPPRNKVLLITGSHPTARVVYKDSQHYRGFLDGKKSEGGNRGGDGHRNLMDITEDDVDNDDEYDEEMQQQQRLRIRRESCNEMQPERIISMKKTAEIAAMFTDLNLDQTTNLLANDLDSDTFADSAQNTEESSPFSDSFEASLGYYP